MLNISKIESLINSKGWSNTYFAGLFDKNKGWVRDWKRGRGLPDANMLQAIADKLGTTVEYLTDQTDIKNKPATVDGDELDENVLRIANKLLLLSPDELAKVEEYADLLGIKRNL